MDFSLIVGDRRLELLRVLHLGTATATPRLRRTPQPRLRERPRSAQLRSHAFHRREYPQLVAAATVSTSASLQPRRIGSASSAG